jgi:hypothetical protein
VAQGPELLLRPCPLQATPGLGFVPSGSAAVFVSSAAFGTGPADASRPAAALQAGPNALADAGGNATAPAASSDAQVRSLGGSRTRTRIPSQRALAHSPLPPLTSPPALSRPVPPSQAAVKLSAAAPSGYGITLLYAPAAAAALQELLNAYAPDGALPLGGLANVEWVASASANASAPPPELSGNGSYIDLVLPAPGWEPSQRVACLRFNLADGGLSGPAKGEDPVAVVPATSANGTATVTCRLRAPGNVALAQGPAMRLPAPTAPASPPPPPPPSLASAAPAPAPQGLLPLPASNNATPAGVTPGPAPRAAPVAAPAAAAKSGGVPVAAVAGGAVAGVAVAAAIAAAVLIIKRRRRDGQVLPTSEAS